MVSNKDEYLNLMIVAYFPVMTDKIFDNVQITSENANNFSRGRVLAKLLHAIMKLKLPTHML